MNISKYILNTMVMLPPIVLFFYVFPELSHILYLVPFAIFTALPVVKRLLPVRHRDALYPAVLMVVLIVLLVSILRALNFIPYTWYDGIFVVPLTINTFITLFISLSSATVIEGILAANVNRAISALFVSILPLLDQVFAVFLVTQGLTYPSALSEAYSYQFIAILALVFTGSTNIDGNLFPPPLSTFQSPLNEFVLIAMILAILGFILYFIIIRTDRHRSEIVSLISPAIFMGAIIGAVTFSAIVILESVNLQLLGGSVAILATVIYIARSSPERRRKRMRKKGTVITR